MPSRASRIRNFVLDTVLPFGGPSYERKRTSRAPEGWVAADAVVTGVEREEKVRGRIRRGNNESLVSGTVIRYAVAGQGVELVDDLDLVGYDIPKVGATERVAYDPNDPSRFALIKPA